MKLIIALLVIATGTAGILIQANADPHRSCTCAGLTCSCSVSCLDIGEIPTCICSTFSCNCVCNPKDSQANPSLPTIDSEQEANSNRMEGYFRNLKTAQGNQLADGIRDLRLAIKSGDAPKYKSTAQLVEATYNQLSAAQQNAFEGWLDSNLR